MSPGQQIDEKIAALGDWRGAALATVRKWQFTPGRLKGEAVPVISTTVVDFHLK